MTSNAAFGGIAWKGWMTPMRDWCWSTGPLGNGWSALVTDSTQSIAPPQPTKYAASAVSKSQIVTEPVLIDDFGLAKQMALNLALSQPPLPVDSQESDIGA